MPERDHDEFLYNPRDEHDACGVGFVADISGRPSHSIVSSAVEALSNLTHRGAFDADGRTGDGAGLLTQLPLKFFQREVERLGRRPQNELAVGVFFLPRDESAADTCRHFADRSLCMHGLIPFGWRNVPVKRDALGTTALQTMPRIEQLLIGPGHLSATEFEISLYRARRELEQHTANLEGFYIPSLSSRTIVYKGLLAGDQLAGFYQDLHEPEFESSLAVFHQRYSTNTFPNWSLAQPFRMLAHNGEINTVSGNRKWIRARELSTTRSGSNGPLSTEGSILWAGGSDSASLDNALEFSVMSGCDLPKSMMMLIPEAYESATEMSAELRGFYDYASIFSEPWDGPAAVAFTDGQFVGAALDRNGLRPARFAITIDGKIVVASEAGAISLASDAIVQKGRLGPGEMIVVDTTAGVLLTNREIKQRVASAHTYSGWVRQSIVNPSELQENQPACKTDEIALIRRMKRFGYTVEDVEKILRPMSSEGREPIGSMGDDTPLAVLSAKPRLLYSYFKQRFAQVTNPAIDPIRERAVMSLTTLLGARPDSTPDAPLSSTLIRMSSPVLTEAQVDWISKQRKSGLRCLTLDSMFKIDDGASALGRAIDELCAKANEAVNAGCSVLIINDLHAGDFEAPIPMLLAIAAVHNRLIREGQRMRTSLIALTGEARDDHHIACLIGFGANAVCPALAFEAVAHDARTRVGSSAPAVRNYRRALEDGLLKIMAKMGISTLAGYCGAQTFEIIGLNGALVDKHFSGATCRLSGIDLDDIGRDSVRFHKAAFDSPDSALEDVGFFRYRVGGEYHSYNPAVFRALHRSVKSKTATQFNDYVLKVDRRPPTSLRDLLEIRRGRPISISSVESAENILVRFSTSGMSLGALSSEAHETLAIAMNRLGAKSNSGEGGEDRRRFEDDRLSNSKIKQVASARFGVTPEYLVSADEIEIKMAQGSKPGEGGQLPGHKVTAEIAAIRHSVPGVTLISPAPHHDIYSIEDLAQLIFDLKQVNKKARIAVKLVSEAGIGTIAAGVAKAGADLIHISGHDGGTGASPLGSIKNAGTPWELGLAETQQALVMNGLRSRVRLRVDGGLKTGRDVMIAAMLGADEFGFATAAVVALGCVMARQCHLNTCPVGIATQDSNLRRKFNGTPESVESFFRGLADDVRGHLAELGIQSLERIVGRSELLFQNPDVKLPRGVSVDLTQLIRSDVRMKSVARSPGELSRDAGSLASAIDLVYEQAISERAAVKASFVIRNTDRAIGARLAGQIARVYGDAGLPEGTIELNFLGSAGQSFGAFNIAGSTLMLTGEANDYVGKGMSGGEIVVRPPSNSLFQWSQNTIIGNTVMYGATGGTLLAAGRAGERFCVRNSGGVAVVEGVGNHGCEYMTAGTVVVLGEVGRNFAAGMTGGVAFIYDERENFRSRCNTELVELSPVSELDFVVVRRLVERHYRMTGSPRASELLANWDRARQLFWQVITQAEASRHREAQIQTANINTFTSVPLTVAE
jgi:glutamate synthase (ferredoxin)